MNLDENVWIISTKDYIYFPKGKYICLAWWNIRMTVCGEAGRRNWSWNLRRRRKREEWVLFWVLQQISLEKCKYKYDISLDLKNISRNRNLFVEDGKSCKSCLVFYPTSLSAKKIIFSLNNILQEKWAFSWSTTYNICTMTIAFLKMICLSIWILSC